MSETDLRTPSDELLLQVADAAVDLYGLALRRAVWRGFAASPDSPTHAEIGAQLDRQFQAVARHADTLRTVFEQHGPWCDERIADALRTGDFGERELAAFARVLPESDDGYAARGTALLSAVTAAIADARPGTGAVGLTFSAYDVGCGLVAAGVMAGLLTCPKTAGAGCAVAAACMITLVVFC